MNKSVYIVIVCKTFVNLDLVFYTSSTYKTDFFWEMFHFLSKKIVVPCVGFVFYKFTA